MRRQQCLGDRVIELDFLEDHANNKRQTRENNAKAAWADFVNAAYLDHDVSPRQHLMEMLALRMPTFWLPGYSQKRQTKHICTRPANIAMEVAKLKAKASAAPDRQDANDFAVRLEEDDNARQSATGQLHSSPTTGRVIQRVKSNKQAMEDEESEEESESESSSEEEESEEEHNKKRRQIKTPKRPPLLANRKLNPAQFPRFNEDQTLRRVHRVYNRFDKDKSVIMAPQADIYYSFDFDLTCMLEGDYLAVVLRDDSVHWVMGEALKSLQVFGYKENRDNVRERFPEDA